MRYPLINYDDYDYIIPAISRGLTFESIHFAFTHVCGYYAPVTWLSYLLEETLTGRMEPWVFHLTNLWLHTANTVLVYLIAKRFLASVRWAFIVALLFALHPAQVETVAWIAERKGLLAALFALLSVNTWTSNNPPLKKYSLVTLFYLMSVFSKPIYLALPLVLLLIAYANSPHDKPGKLLSRGNIVLLSVMVIVSLLQLLYQDRTIDSSRPSKMIFVANGVGQLCMYFTKSFLPLQLITPYPRFYWSGALAILVAVVVGSVIAIMLYATKTQKTGSMFLACFAMLLFPGCGIVSIGRHGLANRYLYLPILGVILASVVMLRNVRLSERFRICIAAFLVLCAFAATGKELLHWRNTTALFERALAIDPHNELARENLYRNALRNRDYNLAAHYAAFQGSREAETLNICGCFFIKYKAPNYRQAESRTM